MGWMPFPLLFLLRPSSPISHYYSTPPSSPLPVPTPSPLLDTAGRFGGNLLVFHADQRKNDRCKSSGDQIYGLYMRAIGRFRLYLIPYHIAYIRSFRSCQACVRAHTYTHTRLAALFPGLPRSAGTRKVKPIWILLKQETVSGSGISWAICKSASCSRQITTPATHHSVFLQAVCLSCRPTNSVKALKG